jgi:uncharacterized protein (TIGR03435 family)
MRTTVLGCLPLLALLPGPAIQAQAPPSNAQAVTFEAASVKERMTPVSGSFVGRRPGGRFAAENATLREIIEYAYQLQRFQLVGSLAPVDSARWDITATLGAAAATAGPDTIGPAVRSLLAERFALAVHRETRTLPVYALRLVRDGVTGPALVKSATDCVALMAAARRGGGPPPPQAQQCGFRGRIGSLQSNGMPLTELALALATRVERPVVDQTGLAGPWDLTLTYAADPAQIPPGTLAPDTRPPAPNPDAPSLFTALQEQLGLRLVSTTAPVDVLVVDRVSRPTPD